MREVTAAEREMAEAELDRHEALPLFIGRPEVGRERRIGEFIRFAREVEDAAWNAAVEEAADTFALADNVHDMRDAIRALKRGSA